MGKSTKRTLKWQHPSRVISLRWAGPFPLMPLLISVLSLQDIPWSWKHRTQLTSSFPGRKWWLTSIWNAELSRTTPRKTRESLPLIYPGEESPLPRHLFPLLPKSTWPCQLWAVHRGNGLGCEAGPTGQESIPLPAGKDSKWEQESRWNCGVRARRPRPGFFGFRTKVSSAPEMVSLSDGSKVSEHSISPPLLITLSSKKLLFASKLSRPWH